MESWAEEVTMDSWHRERRLSKSALLRCLLVTHSVTLASPITVLTVKTTDSETLLSGAATHLMGSEEGSRVFLDNKDVMQEIDVDEEELPDIDDDDSGDVQLLETDLEGDALDGEDDSDHTFSGHTDSVYSVTCSTTDPGLVATGGGDDIVFMWRVGEGTEPKELRGHTDSIASLAFSSDGKLLATGGLDGVVMIWDVLTGTLKHKLEGPGEAIEWVRWHPKGPVILAGSEDFTAWLWNANSGVCLNVFSGHSGSVTCGDFTPDGKSFCTGGGDGSLRIWNPKSAESTNVVQGHPYHTQGVLCLAIHADSSFAITGSEDNTACIVNLQNGRITGTLAGHNKSVECVGLSSMLLLAATGGMDGKLIIWDLQSLTQRSTCEHEDGVVKLIWPSSSHLIYTGCLDGKIRIWDSRTGGMQRIFQGHQDSILDLAVSRGGRYIISGSDDGTARAYDTQYPPS